MRKSLLLIALISSLAYTACSAGDPSIPPLPPNANPNGGGGSDSSPRNATVKGKIAFEGTAPERKKLPTSADPGCMNSGLLDESVVVSDGGLENVIIYVSGGPGLEGKTFAPVKEVATLDQMGCHYIPHALALQTNQKLKIMNSDMVAHNIHGFAEVNPQFNEPQAHKGDETEKTFTKEEIMFPIRCDVHNWMNAFVGVFKTPLHTVSGKGGSFELKMPAGMYEFTAIHEKLGKQTKMVEIADGGSVDLNFSFKNDGKGN